VQAESLLLELREGPPQLLHAQPVQTHLETCPSCPFAPFSSSSSFAAVGVLGGGAGPGRGEEAGVEQREEGRGCGRRRRRDEVAVTTRELSVQLDADVDDRGKQLAADLTGARTDR
jgi:hypothetical protein